MHAVLALVALLALWLSTFQLGVAQQKPDASGDKQDTSTPPKPPTWIGFGGRVVFTLAPGNDGPTNTKIAVALAARLKHKFPTVDVVPEGSWNLGDYLAQCENDPTHTVGAVIALPAGAGSHSADYLVLLRNEARIQFNVMIAECYQDTKRTSVIWVSDTASGEYGRSAIQFLPFAVLTSVYLAFSPQRTYQTTTTVVYPTPNPLPSTGARTNEQTVNSSVINAGGTGTLQQQVVTSVGGANLQFGQTASAEHFTMHAADDAVGKIVTWIDFECKRGPIPIPTDFQSSRVAASADGGKKNFCFW
jgi:hypothetical protein